MQEEGNKALDEGRKATTVKWDQRCGLEMVNRTCNVYGMSHDLKAENARLAEIEIPNVVVALTSPFSIDSVASVFGDVVCKNMDEVDISSETGSVDSDGADNDSSDSTTDNTSGDNSYEFTCNYPYCGLCFQSKAEFEEHKEKFGHKNAITSVIRNISYGVTDEALSSIFEPFNPINVRIARRKDGKSKGYGLAFFTNVADRDASISALDGQQLDGRPIKVTASNNRDDKNDTDSEGDKISESGGSSGDLDTERTVYFGMFPYEIDESFVRDAFSGLSIAGIEICTVNKDGAEYKCALVTFSDSHSYSKALAMNSSNGVDILPSGDVLGTNETSTGTTKVPKGSDSSRKKSRKKVAKKVLKNTLYVGRLPSFITDVGLHEIFDGCNFTEAKIHDGKNSKYGIVVFANEKDPKKALDIVKGTSVEGIEIIVEFKRE